MVPELLNEIVVLVRLFEVDLVLCQLLLHGIQTHTDVILHLFEFLEVRIDFNQLLIDSLMFFRKLFRERCLHGPQQMLPSFKKAKTNKIGQRILNFNPSCSASSCDNHRNRSVDGANEEMQVTQIEKER